MFTGFIFFGVWTLDQQRVSVLQDRIQELEIESETSRILLFYVQVFGDSEGEVCQVLEHNMRQQMNRGYFLLRQLRSFQEANLLADYEQTRAKYLLNNVELWLYSTLVSKRCNFEIKPILFFYKTKELCTDCIAQGEALDQIRAECPLASIYSLAEDEDLDIVSFIKNRYGIETAPAMVINNSVVLNGLQSKDKIKRLISCSG